MFSLPAIVVGIVVVLLTVRFGIPAIQKRLGKGTSDKPGLQLSLPSKIVIVKEDIGATLDFNALRRMARQINEMEDGQVKQEGLKSLQTLMLIVGLPVEEKEPDLAPTVVPVAGETVVEVK